MVSGALLLPVKESYTDFLKRRFGKIVAPTLIWTLVYLALKIWKTPDEVNILQTLLSIPFSAQGSDVLWFMYTLAGLYLVAPVLSGWLEKASRRDIQIVLAMWGITLCYPLVEGYLNIYSGAEGTLYYFSGYAGYFLLGYYLKKFPSALSLPVAASVGVAGAVLIFIVRRLNIEVDFYRMFWYLSVFVAALCVAIWKTVVMAVEKWRPDVSGILVTISNLSFGVYLCHILVMRTFVWNLSVIHGIQNYVEQSLTVAVLSFFLSLALAGALACLPWAQWIVGYRWIVRKAGRCPA